MKVIIGCFEKINIDMSDVYIYNTDIYDLYYYIEKEYGQHWFEDGILYINYPMIESLLHMSAVPDPYYLKKSISIDCNPGSKYKNMIKNNSILLKYLGLYINIGKYIRKNIDGVEEMEIDKLVFDILSLADLNSLQEDILRYIKEYDIDKNNLNN